MTENTNPFDIALNDDIQQRVLTLLNQLDQPHRQHCVDAISEAISLMKKDGASSHLIQLYICQYLFAFNPSQANDSTSSFQAISPSEMDSLEGLPQPDEDSEKRLLSQMAMIKLNGGLGTTMGCAGPKSLIKISDHQSFLDHIVSWRETLQSQKQLSFPLYVMNSFYTDDDTKAYIHSANLDVQMFKQGRVPRLDVKTKAPVSFSDPELNWAPPGHGNLFFALSESGILDACDAQGITTLFISNSDNVASLPDSRLLATMEKNNLDFLMEVTARTHRDIKGGVIVKSEGRYALNENGGQLSNEPQFFNTNSIWITVSAIREYFSQLTQTLPVIQNQKSIEGNAVIQLETAMGSALSIFDRSACVAVSRNRFIPVKTTSDLLLLQSDIIQKINGVGYGYAPEIDLSQLPSLTLSDHYQTIDGYQTLVKAVPSLKHLQSLHLDGPIILGPNVVFKGQVRLSATNPVYLENQMFEDCEETF